MVEFKRIRFYCLFTNSFSAQTSPKHVCAEPSSCHSIAYITSPKCFLLSAFHVIVTASSLAPSLALVDPIYPSPVIALKMQVKDKHILINSQSAFPILFISSFQFFFHSPTSPAHAYMHVLSISYNPQNTGCAPLHVHKMHFQGDFKPGYAKGSTALYYK